MIDYLTVKLRLYLPAILWFSFVVSILVGNTELAIINVLLLLYHRVDQMEVQVIINNNVVNVKPKDEEDKND